MITNSDQEISRLSKLKSSLEACIKNGRCNRTVNQLNAIQQYEQISKQLEAQNIRSAQYPIDMESHFGSSGAIGYLLTILLCLYLGRYITEKGYKTVPNFQNKRHFLKTYLFLFFFMSAVFLVRYWYSSVEIIEKEWFTSESYCVRGTYLTVVHIALIVGSFAIYVFPLALIFTASRLEKIYQFPLSLIFRSEHGSQTLPVIKLDHHDGQCGLRDYLRFWYMVILFAVVCLLTYSGFWVVSVLASGAPVGLYGYSLVVVLFLLFVFFMKIYRNLIELRVRYEKKRKKWIKNKGFGVSIPADPTDRFLGIYGQKMYFAIGASLIAFVSAIRETDFADWLVGFVI